jgi:hypothetical protein
MVEMEATRQRVLPIIVKTRFLIIYDNLRVEIWVLRDERFTSPESLCPFARLGC